VSGTITINSTDLANAIKPQLLQMPEITQQPYSYIIFTDGTNYYAKNGRTGQIDFSGTDAGTVIQNVINAIRNGGTIYIKAGTYPLKKPLDLTTTTGIKIVGDGWQGTTTLLVQTNDYPVIDMTDAWGDIFSDLMIKVDSGYSPNVVVFLARGRTRGEAPFNQFYRVSFYSYGSNTDVLLYNYASEGMLCFYCSFDHQNRGVVVTKSNIDNIQSKFTTVVSGPKPTSTIHFFRSRWMTFSTNTKASVELEGVDIVTFRDCYWGRGTSLNFPIRFRWASPPQPAGPILFDGCLWDSAIMTSDPVSSETSIIDLVIQNSQCYTSQSGTIIYFPGSYPYLRGLTYRNVRLNQVNEVIQLGVIAGGYIDTLSDNPSYEPYINITNAVYRSEIHMYYASRLTLPSTVDKVTVIRTAYPSWSNKGTATFSGDGTTTQFKIQHGLASTPTKILITPGSNDAKGAFYATADATYIYINYDTAPPTGTNNVVLYWYAEV